MATTKVIDGLHRLSLSGANAYLLEDGPSLVLIDTGFPDKAPVVLEAVKGLRRQPSDLKHIILTHAHFDHIGSLAALKTATGAETWMHAIDAPIAEAGGPFRPLTAARGLVPGLLYKIFAGRAGKTEPAKIDHKVSGGEILPMAGGLRVIRAPGHCAGQIALLWESRDVLFAGDACMNLFGLTPPVGWENEKQGYATLQKLAGYGYDTACFGHGKPIVGRAAAKMQHAFG